MLILIKYSLHISGFTPFWASHNYLKWLLQINSENPIWLIGCNDVLWHDMADTQQWNLNVINSLAPRKFQINFRQLLLKLNLVINGCDTSYEIALSLVQSDLTDD